MTKFPDLPLPKGYEYVRPLLDPDLTPAPPPPPPKPLDDDILLQEAYSSGYDAATQEHAAVDAAPYEAGYGAGYLDGYKAGHGDTL